MMYIKCMIIYTIISLGLNSPALAQTWVCLNHKCEIGNIIQDDNTTDTTTPKQRRITIWNPDGSQTIINEDTKKGRTDVWHPDGSRSIIIKEEE